VELNRNQYFMIGLVVLMFGSQFRYLSAFVLNERTTTFLAEKLNKGGDAQKLMPANGPGIKKRISPPEWSGWAMLSLGSVLVLHSLAMKKPDG
jgi:hypothetical protein